MRRIRVEQIENIITDLFLKSNFYINPDLLEALQQALIEETSPVGKNVLQNIIENDKISSMENIAICQDTGMAVVFVELGQEVQIINGNFKEAINRGVEKAYLEGYLRKSVVYDPLFDRINTKTNTPAIIYTDIVPGCEIKFSVIPKGFGGENMSALAMLTPADGVEGVIEFVVDTVKKAGPNPCPPIIVGIGIGGTAESAMLIAKKTFFRKIIQVNNNIKYAKLEKEIKNRINNLGIGPGGLGGNTTCLAVFLDYLPTHIGSLPVAVNISCHATRHASGVL